MSSVAVLQIIVVGAGIGGLSAAIALRNAGHIVKVLERSSMNKEIGAALTLSPNATRVIRSWGLNLEKAGFVPSLGIEVVRADVHSMEKVVEYSWETDEKTFGAPFGSLHRVDLHEALKAMASDRAGSGIPVEVITDAEVVSFDAHSGSVTLKNASTLTADLIVAADGVHSQAHEYVLGFKEPILHSDTTVIRFLIPSDIVRGDPTTAPLLPSRDGQNSIYTISDPSRWLLRYPCRRNELQNFVAYCRNCNENGAVKSRDTKSNQGSLLRRLQTFHPGIVSLCQKTTEVLPQLTCTDRKPLPKLHLHRLVLIGDAAHPMLPNFGQGAGMAIEDAAVLGVLFSRVHDVSEIPHRLKLFERTRLVRVSAIQILSRLPLNSYSTEEVASEFRKFLPAEDLPMEDYQQILWLSLFRLVLDSILTDLSELVTKAGNAAKPSEGEMGKSREGSGCDTAH